MNLAIDINDVLRDFSHQYNVMYKKIINPYFQLEDEDIKSFDFMDIFPFDTKKDMQRFQYVDAPFELYARAELCDKKLRSEFNIWCDNVLGNLDDEFIPNIICVSPMEIALSIQSTYSFLSANGIRVREMYFPKDSSTIWDRCDILITANPKLLSTVPENKFVIKINMPYNTDVTAKYSFDNLLDVIHDPNT